MSSYRSTYTPWGKTLGSTSATGTTAAKTTDSSPASQYDGYSRRYGSGSSSTATAPPISYRSPFTSGARERSTSRGSDSTSALIDKYGTKEGAGERLSLRDKFNYPGRRVTEEEDDKKRDRSRDLSAYSRSLGRSTSAKSPEPPPDKGRDLSAYSRTLGRSTSVKSRDLSPEPPPDKGVYGSSSAGSLSSYRLYGRGSTYSRSNSRDAGDSGSSTTSTPATTPVQIPTSLRFGSSTRYGASIATRSPVSEKAPPIFGVSSDRYSRYSRNTSTEDKKDHIAPDYSSTLALKSPSASSRTPVATVKPTAANSSKVADTKKNYKDEPSSSSEEEEESSDDDEKPPTIYMTVITRGTSPTPPSTSIYVRSRRADLARVIEKTIAKPTKRPEMVDKEIQSDRGDDTAKLSRFGSSCRSSASPWSSYLDRYGAGSPYSSRYSSRLDRYGSYGSSSRSSDKDTSATARDKPDQNTNSTELRSRTLGTDSPEIKTSTIESKKEISTPLSPSKVSPNSSVLNKEASNTETKPKSTQIIETTVPKSPKESNAVAEKSTCVTTGGESATDLSKKEKDVPKSPKENSVKSEVSTDKLPRSRSGEQTMKDVANKEKDVPKSPKESIVKNEVTGEKPPASRTADQVKKEISKKDKDVPKTSKDIEIKNDVISRTDSSSSVSKSPSLSRNGSSKNMAGKPPLKSDSSQEISTSSNLKSKSSSSSSLPDSPVSKTPPLSPLSTSSPKTSSKLDSPEASTKKLPPPFPKDGTSLKPSSSLHSINKSTAVNKDFRKSPLNVDLPNTSNTEDTQKTKEKQRKAGKKINRSSSISSGDSEPLPEQGSTSSLPATLDKSAAALRISKSLSKLAPGGPTPNLLQVPKPSSGSPKRKSPSRTKTPSRSPSKSPSQRRKRSATRSSSSDSSSSESSSCSSSSESSSSSSDEEDRKSSSSVPRRRQRGNRSPSVSEKRKSTASIASAKSSADDLSVTADKPPRPPSSTKAPPKNEEAKSFLMRALAPVTNLFKMRQDVSESKSSENIPDSLPRTGSNTSLSKSSDKEDSKRSDDEKKPKKHRIRHIESGERAWWLDKNSEVPEGILRIQSNKSIAKLAEAVAELQKSDNKGRLRNHLKKQESGERAWWLDSNANIPEGIQKIMSNSSVNQTTDSDSEKKKLPGLNKVKSSRSVSKMQGNGTDKPSLYKIRHQQSGEKAWWLCSSGNIPEGVVRLETSSSDEESSSSELEKGANEKPTDENSSVPKFPLTIPEPRSRKGSASSVKDTAGEVLKEDSGRQSPYDNVKEEPSSKKQSSPAKKAVRPKHLPLFISSHTNIDDILGTAATMVEPAMGVAKLKRMLESKDAEPSDDEDLEGQSSGCEEVDAKQVRVHDSTAKKPSIKHVGNVTGDSKRKQSSGMIKLDDTALQLYKDGDYGSYLDLEASINEQHEEFEGFQDNRKNSIVLRTQLSVRVHTIIEKLLNSEGRELRRALFSLKQIFQEDKDLVHEFVQNDGLACLIKVGSEADQNYQNYILRALGQVMLYVDGMNGVMEHNQTVQWLYTLIASKYRLVVKTALKLLLVFVEYTEANCLLLIKAVHAVDTSHGQLPWSNIMKLLKDYDAADTELLIYATTLINKTLNGIPDQDTYYDQVDALEEQGIEGAIQRYMSKQGTDLDLLRQLQIYEAVLHHEDGEEKGTPLKQLDETIRKTLRNRKSLNESMSTERRKSRRHSTGTSPLSSLTLNNSTRLNNSSLHTSTVADDEETESSSSRSSPVPGEVHLNGNHRESKGDVGVTPALRRRRERAERQRSFIREQQETAATLKATLGNTEDDLEDENQKHSRIGNGTLDGDIRSSNKLQLNRVSSRKDMTPLLNAMNSAESESKAVDSNGILKKPWVLSMMYGKNGEGTENGEVEEGKPVAENGTDDSSERKKLLQLKRENTVKDLTQKLASQNILSSPVDEGNNKINRIGDMTGLISKAKEGLAKSKSKADIAKSPTGENVPKVLEVKKSETELHWEELVQAMKRPLSLCDLDFTDLNSEDEVDILSPTNISNGGPPPPPPVPMAPGMPRSGAPPPPPPVSRFSNVTAPPPFPPTNNSSPAFGINVRNNRNSASTTDSSTNKSPPSPVKKTKKTVKLFWKEVRDDPIILAKLQKTGMIWDELNAVTVDTQKLEHLFESRAKDLITKKQQEMNKNKEIIVLDHKRSNAINIGMTKLPPPRSIKTAILKMDATIMNREGIEKLLTMLPTEEERSKIQEAQMANPDLPLGSAEQFLLTLASISELPARLKLWAFKLDYENSEKEIAEPLMDLKQGMETLKANKTFRGILSTLLSIGIFLNGAEVKGFQIEYLAKVPEVKDTVHKHSLLHHLCHMVMEKFPDSSDLYSEIGAVTRASKVDFDELSSNILKMEQECKASWDHLKVIAKHDGSTMMKVKMSDFLADCAERIIVLGIVHRRVMNRFHKFLLWLGIPLHRVLDMKPNEFCRIVSEFALEYRTTRERVLQQLEKKANHRERNKTRGKMITEVGKFRTKEDRADAELRQLLGSDISDAESIHGTLPWRRQRKDLGRTSLGPLIKDETVNGNLTDGDDEILESLVKTATKAPATRTTPRERKRTRHADRKSLKRSRTRENNPLEGSRESP